MIRTLLLISAASFVLAAACIGGAAALGGRDLAEHGWHIGLGHGAQIRPWPGAEADDDRAPESGTATREIAWTGADALDVDVPADIQFTQGSGPAKLVVSGPKAMVDALQLSGSRLTLGDDDDGAGRLAITLNAPAVKRFALAGDESLTLAGLDEDELDIDISGHGDVRAAGKARQARVDISGDGDVDLAKLAARDADVDINGSGRAALAPTGSANLHISGSGEIDLLSRPASLSSDVTGSGRIVQKGGEKG